MNEIKGFPQIDWYLYQNFLFRAIPGITVWHGRTGFKLNNCGWWGRRLIEMHASWGRDKIIIHGWWGTKKIQMYGWWGHILQLKCMHVVLFTYISTFNIRCL